jgi:uncharacterized OsmC-like protein
MNINNTNSDLNLRASISKEIIMLFVALFVSCAIMYYAALPVHREAQIAKLEISVKEKNIESKKLLLSRITKLNSKSREVDNENIKKVDSLIPNRNNYEDYLAHIVKLASSKNIIIDDFSVSGSEQNSKEKNKKSKLSEVEINFSASGGFLNFINFLQAVENGIPFIQVESISVSGEKKDKPKESKEAKASSGLILKYEISLKFYYH